MNEATDSRDARDARGLRLGIIRQQFKAGNLTREQAVELLNMPLSPGNPATTCDDSAYLDTTWIEEWWQQCAARLEELRDMAWREVERFDTTAKAARDKSAQTMNHLAKRIARLERLLELCQPYLPVASGIERDVSNALNMVREVAQTTESETETS